MKIIILSRNAQLYSTQSLIKACVDRGHKVMVVDHQRCIVRIGLSQMEVVYENNPLNEVDAIIPRIGATATSYGCMVVRQFEAMGVFTATPSDSILKARDKIHCLQLLALNGVPVPLTMVPSSVSTNYDYFNRNLEYPAVLKLKESTHGLGVILCENSKNMEASIEAFNYLKQEILIQQFIAEAKGMDIRAFVVDGRVVGSMKRQAVEGEFRSNLHRGGSSQKEALTEEEYLIATKAAAIVGLPVAGVDILRTQNGPMVLEVNASPGLEGIELTTKMDIAGKIVEYIERNQSKPIRNGSRSTDHI